MARRQVIIPQNDFSFGQTRRDGHDRDDVPIVQSGLRSATNTLPTATGSLRKRPGTIDTGLTTTRAGHSVDLGGGDEYQVILTNGVITLRDVDDAVVTTHSGAPWTGDEYLWVVGDPEAKAIIVGGADIQPYALTKGSSWAFGAFAFAPSVGSGTAQPYYNFSPGVTLSPSGYTGSITVTASSAVFDASHVGEIIRYVDREISITGFTSSTVVTGTVLQELPPTKTITVTDGSGFLVGQAVEEAVKGGQGIITAISTNVLTVVVTKNWDGFAGSNDLIAEDTESAIVSVSVAASPAAIALWDEPMMSSYRGYPGSAVKHAGRLVFGQFSSSPDAVAISSAGLINDFELGANDGDAIIERIGSDGGDVLHVVSAEDLIILTSKGCYYVETRDGSAITPTSFAPSRFNRAGCNSVPPAAVDDGLIFVARNGTNVMAAYLAGDQYRAWTADQVSQYQEGVVSSPVWLSAPSDDSERPERYIYIVNADGTAGIMRWERSRQQVIGWFPWTTDGLFKSIFHAFGAMYCVVDRTVSWRIEKFNADTYVDSDAGSLTGHHLTSQSVVVWHEGWDYGDFTVDGSGNVEDNDGVVPTLHVAGTPQAGLPFTAEIEPWPRRSTEFYGASRAVKRLVLMVVSFIDTVEAKFNGAIWGGYVSGDDLTSPPSPQTIDVKFGASGRESYERNVITHDRPGTFGVTMIKQKVTL